MCVQKDQFYSSFVFRLQCTKAPAAAGCFSYKHGPNEAINQVLEQKHIMSSPIDPAIVPHLELLLPAFNPSVQTVRDRPTAALIRLLDYRKGSAVEFYFEKFMLRPRCYIHSFMRVRQAVSWLSVCECAHKCVCLNWHFNCIALLLSGAGVNS